MFLISPKNRPPEPVHPTHIPPTEDPSDRNPGRVKRACNRCRIKKIKCDGTYPCARCKQDKIVCTMDRRHKTDIKQLSRHASPVTMKIQITDAYASVSYISTLETQQALLLDTLSQFCDIHHNDAAADQILTRLENGGFDMVKIRERQQATAATIEASNGHSKQRTPSSKQTAPRQQAALANCSRSNLASTAPITGEVAQDDLAVAQTVPLDAVMAGFNLECVDAWDECQAVDQRVPVIEHTQPPSSLDMTTDQHPVNTCNDTWSFDPDQFLYIDPTTMDLNAHDAFTDQWWKSWVGVMDQLENIAENE